MYLENLNLHQNNIKKYSDRLFSYKIRYVNAEEEL